MCLCECVKNVNTYVMTFKSRDYLWRIIKSSFHGIKKNSVAMIIDCHARWIENRYEKLSTNLFKIKWWKRRDIELRFFFRVVEGCQLMLFSPRNAKREEDDIANNSHHCPRCHDARRRDASLRCRASARSANVHWRSRRIFLLSMLLDN